MKVDRDRERADEHRTDQRGPECRAQVLGGVLKPTDLAALTGPDARLHDVAELRREQPHADAEQRHRARERDVVDVRLDRGHQPERRAEHDEQPGADDAARA
jgi:hypothetical protein